MLSKLKKGISRRFSFRHSKSESQEKLSQSTLVTPSTFADLHAMRENNEALTLKSRLPGFVFGLFRNVAARRFQIEKSVSTIKLSLIAEYTEVLNFNHLAIWARDKNNKLYKVDSGYHCEMSSVFEALPDPNKAMLGNGSNSVSVHSKREIKPWWKVSLDRPHHVAFIEFYNRKDKCGIRAKSMVITCFDENQEKVFQAGHIIKKGASLAFYNWALPLMEECVEYFKSIQLIDEAKEIEQAFVKYITATTTKDERRQELLAYFQKVHTLIESETPDLPNQQSDALLINIPSETRHLRIVGYRRKLLRPVKLNVIIDGVISTLLEIDDPNYLESHFELRKCVWTLQHPHIFSIPSEQLENAKEVKVWCDDFHSGDVFVQRHIQVSPDGETWETVESTLDNLTARLALLSAQEWLFGETWDHTFAEQLGHFLATYRMSQARTVKPLLRANRQLLPTFYGGVLRGGCTAKYIPPVVYTRHGLTVPFEHLDSAFLANRMKRFADFLEQKLNLKAFPCYGTLLGIHRDGDFLPHDDDIDLAVVVDLPLETDYLKATLQWAETIRKLGVECRPPTPSSLNLHCYFEDFDMDLFFIYRIPDKPKRVWTHMQGYNAREVKRSLLEPISTIQFCGYDFYAPAKIEAFLEDRYGKGWVTPDPTYEL